MSSEHKTNEIKSELSLSFYRLFKEFEDEIGEYCSTCLKEISNYFSVEKFYISFEQRNSTRSYLRIIENNLWKILSNHSDKLNSYGLFPFIINDNIKIDFRSLQQALIEISNHESWSSKEWGKTKSSTIFLILNQIKTYRQEIKDNYLLLSSTPQLEFLLAESKLCYLLLKDSHEIISKRNTHSYLNNFSQEVEKNKLSSHLLKSTDFLLCKFCYRVANNSGLCPKHQTSIVDSNKSNRLGKTVFEALEPDEKEMLDNYKFKRNLVQHNDFRLHSDFMIEEIPDTETPALPTNSFIHSMVYDLKQEHWSNVNISKFQEFSASLPDLPNGLNEAISNASSLKDLSKTLYSEGFLNNHYEASQHPFWLINAIVLEAMLSRRERLVTTDRLLVRNERWFYKKIVLNMSYVEILNSEINEGHDKNEPISLSNIKKVVPKMLKEGHTIEKALYYTVAPV